MNLLHECINFDCIHVNLQQCHCNPLKNENYCLFILGLIVIIIDIPIILLDIQISWITHWLNEQDGKKLLIYVLIA